MSDLENVREILRTLAEVRDGPFYSLWARLPHHSARPMPQIDFRIYQVADSAEASLNVWVSTTRMDWAEVSWGVNLTTTPKSFIVSGSVEISDNNETHEVVVFSADTEDCKEASRLIRQFSNKVCAELGPLTENTDKAA